MANVTANREGWTGFLIPDEVASVTATSEQGPHVGPAVPDTDNQGNMVLRTLRTDRIGSEAALTLTVDQGGQAMARIPAEILPTYDGIEYAWMDPVICWSFRSPLLFSTDKMRLSRWGGPRGYLKAPVYSNNLLDWVFSNEHDICPAGDDELLMVRLVASSIAFTAISSTYEDGYFLGAYLSPRRSQRQVIDTDVLSPLFDDIINVRVAVANGSGLLIVQARAISTGQDRLYQFASTDGGQSWEYVDSTSTTIADSPTGIADVESFASGFIFAYADQADASQQLRLGRITSPFEPIWTASYTHVGTAMWNDSTATRVNALEWALCSAETGEVYLTGLTYGSTEHRGLTFRSLDGEVWDRLQGANGWIILDVAYSRPTDTDAVWSRGGIDWVGVSASLRWSARIGGWSEYGVTSPTFLGWSPTRGAPNAAATCGWTRSYLPLGVVPSDVGWTLASGGAASEAVFFTLSLTGSGGARTERSWEIEGTTVDAPRMVMFSKVNFASIANMVDKNAPIFLEYVASNGTKSAGIRVAIGADTVQVFVRTGLTSYTAVGSPATVSLATYSYKTFFAWVSFDFDAMTCDFSIYGSDTTAGALQIYGFVLERDGIATTDIFAHEPLTKTKFGSCLMTGESSSWGYVFTHDSIIFTPANPATYRQGRPLSGPIVHFPEALVQVAGGIAAVHDSWLISTGHEKAIENVLSPDPGLVWRSGDVAENVITVTLASDLTGPMIGVLLKGIVAEDIKIEGHVADSATWVEVVSYGDALIKLDATRTLTSPILKPATATTGETIHLRENELAGAWMTLGWEGRQILDNRSGHWVPGYGSHPPTIRFDGASIAETGGVMQVMPKDLCLLVWLGDATIDQIKITFAASVASVEHDAGWPAGTSWELQRVIVGPVIVAGDDPDWGRTVRTSVPTQVQTLPSGRVRPKATLPARREMDVAWTDGVDTRGLRDDAVDPDYISASTVGSGHAIADVGSTPWTMEGLLSRIQGEAGEVVCFRVGMGEMTEGSGLILNRRHEFIHGRITSVVSHDSVLGEEDVDQVLRLGTITIREEV